MTIAGACRGKNLRALFSSNGMKRKHTTIGVEDMIKV
jgi:hypothetical protein